MHNVHGIQARDGDGGSSKLSTSTIVIIAVVCGCVVALVFALFLWRLLYRICRPKKPTPLPPVQPLAYEREQQLATLAEFKNRHSTFYESDSLHALSYIKRPLHHVASEASLIPGSSVASSRQNSILAEDATSAESLSPYVTPLPADSHPLPHPHFGVAASPHASLASFSSSAGDTEAVSASPCAPFPDATDSVDHVTPLSGPPSPSASSNMSSIGGPRPSGRSVSRSRSRISLASSAGTTYSMQTTHSRGSTLRGAPHSRHSNIQIVLPAPLAPEMYPYAQSAGQDGINSNRSSYALSSVQGDGSSRRSVFVDQWVPVGIRSLSMGNMVEKGSTNFAAIPTHTVRSHTSTQPRIPSSLSQSTTISSHHSARRAQSQPRLNTSPSNYPKLASSASSSNLRDRERVPPVPRIPSAHSDISSVPQEHEQIRGRSRTSTSRSVGPLQTERSFSQQMPGEWQKENLRTAPPVVVARSGPQGPTDLEQPLPQLFLESSEHRPRSRTREGTLHKKRQDVPT
ncbi:hypothetical protein AcV5_004336 [Taiwanofungus camphoratus]|nr:hypothetical protein AcV5_004336 [Antrodia cinnamomea]KAI0961325.1 hypothetical protein AcV7_000458 [Antrodia cinnamomea]